MCGDGCSNSSGNFLPVWMQLVHESIYETVLNQLIDVYKQVKMGDPLEKGTLVGPLHTRASKENFEKGIEIIKFQACIFHL